MLKNGKLSLMADKGILTASFIVIVILVLSSLALNKIKEQINYEIQENLHTILITTHKALDFWIENKINDAQMIVGRPDVRQLTKELLSLPRNKASLRNSDSLQKVREIMQPWIDKHSDLGIFIISPDGTNIASMRDENLGADNLFSSYGDYLENMLNGKPQLVLPLHSDVALPNITGQLTSTEPTMFIGVPLFNQTGEVIAAFTIRIDPSLDFSNIIKIAHARKSGDSYAFNKAGTVISSIRFDDHIRKVGLIKPHERSILKLSLRDPGVNLLEDTQLDLARYNMPLTLMARSAIVGGAGFNIEGYRDYRGVSVIGAWLWDSNYNFGLTYEVDVSEAFQASRLIRQLLLSILSVTVLLFLALSYGLVKRNKRVDVINQELNSEIVKRKKSEERFRNLLESSPNAMIVTDSAGKIVLVNNEVGNIFDYSPDELIGEVVEALMPQRFASRHLKRREKFLESPSTRPMGVGIELFGLRKGGREFPIEVSLSSVETGDTITVIATVLDITARKEAEREIKESREQFQRLVENLENNYFFYAHDIKGIFSYLSPSITQILGYLPQEFMSHYAEKLTDNPINGQVEHYTDLSIQGIKQAPYLLEVYHKDGSKRWLEVSETPVFNGNNEVIFVEGLANDITARIHTEELLKSNESSLLEAQRIAHLGNWEWDILLNKLVWSNEVYQILGKSPAEFPESYETFMEFVHPDDRALIKAAVNNTTLKDAQYSIEYRVVQPSGAVRIVQEQGEVSFNDELCAISVLGTMLDITERKKVEDELRQHREHLEELVDERTNKLQEEITERQYIEEELRRNMDDLERFSRMAVGREDQMIKLKEEINQLLGELGQNSKYEIAELTEETLLK